MLRLQKCSKGHCNYTEISFFFSSRRRHTRYWRDWSSDVCSSDLIGRLAVQLIWEEMIMISNDESWDGSAGHPAHPSRREVIAGAASASMVISMPLGTTAQSQGTGSGSAASEASVKLTVNGTHHAL